MITQSRDGSMWRIGTQAEVAEIANGTSVGLTITGHLIGHVTGTTTKCS